MENTVISEMLMWILIGMLGLLFLLIIVYIILKLKTSAKKEEKPEEDIELMQDKPKNKEKKKKNTEAITYSKQSIFDFMEFDEVQDNMIIQKSGKRYVMVVECQGINYDLMSEVEKVSVEEGFQQFLNTLRHPIQIYIQTRTVNLGKSLAGYRQKIREIEMKYNKMLYEYREMQNSEIYSNAELDKYYYELTKQRNLLEYGVDILNNTEKMSLNKNVLNKKYYVVISYFAEENPQENYDKEEIRNMAFSELYTKSQAIIRTLSACSVSGKILNSKELVELLYMAYNRDDAELYGVDTAIRAGYDSLYSTSQDVFEKKIKALDRKIQESASQRANEAIDKAISAKQKKAEEKEDTMEDLIQNLAQIIIKENRQYIGQDVVDEALKEINGENDKKEEDSDVQETKETTSRRGRKKVNK